MTAPKDAATPRPWREGRCGGSIVADVDDNTHAMLKDDREFYGGALIAESIKPGNLELILRAVNTHDALVEALRSFPGFTDDTSVGDPWIEKKNAALALAGVES